MRIPKEIPDQNISFFAQASYGVYEKNSREYIENHIAGSKVLKEFYIDSWKASLIEKDDKLYISFRGTDNFKNILYDIERFLGEDTQHILHANEEIKKWEKFYNKKIVAVTGHSAGGWLASRVLEDVDGIFRVTFNSPAAKQGSRDLNLRTSQDLVSSRFGQRSNYHTLVKGGHKMINFLTSNGKPDGRPVEETKWEELKINPHRPNSKHYCDINSAPKENPKKVSTLCNNLSHCQKTLLNFLDTNAGLDTLNTNVSDLDLLDFKSQNFGRDYRHHFEVKDGFAVKVLQGAELLAKELYEFSQGQASEDHKAAKRHHISSAYHIATHQAHDKVTQNHYNHTYEFITQRLVAQILPSALHDRMIDVEKIRDEHRENLIELNRRLEQNGIFEINGQDLISKMDRLNTDTQKFYQKTIRSKRNLIDKLRKFGVVCGLTKSFIIGESHLPGIKAFLGVSGAGYNFLTLGKERKEVKLDDAFQRARQLNLQTRETVLELIMRRDNNDAQLLAIRQAALDLHVNKLDLFKPDEQAKLLTDDLNNSHKALSDAETEIARKRAEMVGLDFGINQLSSYQSRKEKVAHQLQRRAQILTKQAQRLKLEEEIEGLNFLVEDQKKNISKITDAAKTVERNHDLLQLIYTHSKVTITDSQKREAETLAIFKALYGTHLEGREDQKAILATLTALGEYSHSLGYPGVSEFIEVTSAGFKLKEDYAVIYRHFLTDMDAFKTALGKETIYDAFQTLTTSDKLSLYVIPLIGSVMTVLTACQKGYKLYKRIQSHQNGELELGFTERVIIERTEALIHNLSLNIGSGLSQLSKLQNHNFQTILEEFDALRQSVGYLEERLEKVFKSGIHSVLEKLDEAVYIDYSTRSDQKAFEINKYYQEFPLKLNSSNQFQKVFSKNLEEICQGYFNGYEQGLFLSIDSSYVRLVPERFTGLLSLKLCGKEAAKKTPNLLLLLNLSDKFIDFISKLDMKTVTAHPMIKNGWLKICEEVLEAQGKIFEINHTIDNLIHITIEIKKNILDELNLKAEKTHISAKLQMDKILQANWQNFSEQNLSISLAHIVGADKFFLNNHFVATDYFNDETMQRHVWDPNHFSTLRKTAYVSSSAFIGFASTAMVAKTMTLGTAAVLTPVALPFIIPAVFVTGSIALYKVMKQDDYTNQILEETNKSLKSVAMKGLSFNEVDFNQLLYLSLVDRKIKFLPCENSMPIPSVQVRLKPANYPAFHNIFDQSTYSPELGVHFPENCLVTLEELKKIPSSNIQNSALYQKKVRKLHLQYFQFLDYKLAGKDFNPNNRFNNLNDFIFIPSLTNDLPPLAFPKNFIDEYEILLHSKTYNFESSGKGTLTPYYEFDAKLGQIKLHYKFLDMTQGEEKDYGNFLIAQFNPVTRDAYKQTLTGEEEDDYSKLELLLQTFYGSFFKLGMPDNQSFRLASGFIIPVESPFVGLFSLLAQNPSCLIFEPTNEINRYFSFIKVSPRFSFGKHFTELESICESSSLTDPLFLQDYQESYDLLRGQLTLFYNLDDKTFAHLHEVLEILPPESLLNFYRFVTFGKEKELSEDAIDTFLSLVDRMKNENYEKLNQQFMQICAIKQKLKTPKIQ